jgi:hypothetical protein
VKEVLTYCAPMLTYCTPMDIHAKKDAACFNRMSSTK